MGEQSVLTALFVHGREEQKPTNHGPRSGSGQRKKKSSEHGDDQKIDRERFPARGKIRELREAGLVSWFLQGKTHLLKPN